MSEKKNTRTKDDKCVFSASDENFSVGDVLARIEWYAYVYKYTRVGETHIGMQMEANSDSSRTRRFVPDRFFDVSSARSPTRRFGCSALERVYVYIYLNMYSIFHDQGYVVPPIRHRSFAALAAHNRSKHTFSDIMYAP